MLSPEFLLKGVAAPLVAAFATTLVSHRFATGRRGVAALGLIAGQSLGMALTLWGQDDWLPDRNLEWVPWVTVGAAAIGPVLVAGGLAAIERWILAAFVALAAAVLVVPTWPDLWPSRGVSMLALVGALTILARGIDHLARRAPPRLVAASMALTAATAALLIAASISLSLAGVVLILAAALAGTAAALLVRPDESAVRGLSLPYAVALVCWCYASAIELPPPTPPLVPLLLLPLAPLVLWGVSVGPVAGRTPRVRAIAGVVLVVAYLAAVGAWTWSRTEKGDDEYALVSK